VGEGQLVGLIGPNGAGKTTFIDAISGFVRCDGRVELDGEDLTGAPPHVRARAALPERGSRSSCSTTSRSARTCSSRRTALGLDDDPRDGVGARPASAEITPALVLLGIENTVQQMPSELSQGQRKLVGLARALAPQPRVLCLDEPAAGLDTRESEELGARLRGLADDGQAMLLVDHDMGLVLGICDEVVVLEFGEVIARGVPDVVRNDPQVIKAYLGGAAPTLAAGEDARG
jgi:branched-chain amino acid transport system ATP-binding protein